MPSKVRNAPSNSDRIMIIGGYGEVGLSIVERLAPLFHHRLIIVGRNLDKARVRTH